MQLPVALFKPKLEKLKKNPLQEKFLYFLIFLGIELSSSNTFSK